MKMFLKDPEASKALSESDRPTNIYAIKGTMLAQCFPRLLCALCG